MGSLVQILSLQWQYLNQIINTKEKYIPLPLLSQLSHGAVSRSEIQIFYFMHVAKKSYLVQLRRHPGQHSPFGGLNNDLRLLSDQGHPLLQLLDTSGNLGVSIGKGGSHVGSCCGGG